MLVDILIGKTKYKIPCKIDEKEKLLELAARLDQRVRELSFKARSTDEGMLLVMAALTLEEELNKKNETIETSPINEEEIFNALSDNMENVASYIEKLAERISNY